MLIKGTVKITIPVGAAIAVVHTDIGTTSASSTNSEIIILFLERVLERRVVQRVLVAAAAAAAARVAPTVDTCTVHGNYSTVYACCRPFLVPLLGPYYS